MEFRNRVSERVRMHAPVGSKFAPEYEIRIDKKGHKTLEQTGETNIYEKTQADLEECMIENIITRIMQGDISALNKAKAQYLDTTDMPRTLAEAQNTVIRLTQEFEKLPIDIKRKFNMSAEQYIASYGNEKWMEDMGINKLIKPDVEETKTEVTE